MEYRFDTFPNPPVAYSPVTTTVNASGGLVRGTGVKCSDGRVLHVWVERWAGSGEGRTRIYQGYAADVDTYLTSDGSVYSGTESVTLLYGCTDLTVFRDSYIGEAFVSVGPDGAFYLICQLLGNHSDMTWDVLEDPGTTIVNSTSRTIVWRSTDDGATWAYHTYMPTTFLSGNDAASSGGRYPIAGKIETLPLSDANGGAWIVAAPNQVSGGGGSGVVVNAFYMSTDSGATWTLEHTQSSGLWHGQAGSGFAVGSDGRVYNKLTLSAKSTATTAWWTRSAANDFSGTWDDYDTDTAGGDPTDQRPGPWFTLFGDSVNIYTMQPPVGMTVTSSLLTIYSVDLGATPTPNLPGDYTEYAELDVTNLNTSQDIPILMPLDANWAGVWVGTQVVGLPLIGCPATGRLLIPHKRWYEQTDATSRSRLADQNINAVNQWCQDVYAAGGTTKPVRLPYIADEPRAHYQTWLEMERWSETVCWAERLHIPYKGQPERDWWNLLAVERWANRA